MHAFQKPVLDMAFECGGHEYRDAIRDPISWSEKQPYLAAKEHEATGKSEAQTVIKYVLRSPDGSTPVFWAAYPHQSKLDLYLFHHAPFDVEEARREARSLLRVLTGANDRILPPDQIATFRLDGLVASDARDGLHSFLRWALVRMLETEATRASA